MLLIPEPIQNQQVNPQLQCDTNKAIPKELATTMEQMKAEVSQFIASVVQEILGVQSTANDVLKQLSEKVVVQETTIVCLQDELDQTNKKMKIITKIAQDAIYMAMDNKKKLDEAQEQVQQQNKDTKENANCTTQAEKDKDIGLSTSAFFLIGVQRLKRFHRMHPECDPAAVIGQTLTLLQLFPAMDKVIPTDVKKVKSRSASNVAIVYMRTEQMKKEAILGIKALVRDNKLELRKVTVKDSFHLSKIEEMKTLNKKGLDLCKTKQAAKFQVINRKGYPILQTGKKNHSKFTDFIEANNQKTQTAPNKDNNKKAPLPTPSKKPQPQGDEELPANANGMAPSYHIASTPSVAPPSVVDWPATSGDWPATSGDWSATSGDWPATSGDWLATSGDSTAAYGDPSTITVITLCDRHGIDCTDQSCQPVQLYMASDGT